MNFCTVSYYDYDSVTVLYYHACSTQDTFLQANASELLENLEEMFTMITRPERVKDSQHLLSCGKVNLTF